MRSVCYSTVVPREQIIVFGKRLPERDFGDGQVAQRLFMHALRKAWRLVFSRLLLYKFDIYAQKTTI